MKIVFLNLWYGKLATGLIDYIGSHAGAEVFCFQEADERVVEMLKGWLPKYEYFYCECDAVNEDAFHQATFVRNDLDLVSWEKVHGEDLTVGLGILATIKMGWKTVGVVNFHGLAKPGEKLDTPERLKQSRGIIEMLEDFEGEKIVGGDFNLMPEIESIGMFEKAGYRDLIKEYGVTNTRNRHAWEKWPESPQYYSDYVFVSENVKVSSFEVPQPDEVLVSDHQPMVLEIEV